jgi:uncharacterized coiled-coil DUF342 family protein
MTQEEINNIKQQLDSINAVKEKWFAKKEALSTQIKEAITSIKKTREERNKHTSAVRSVKKERDKLNEQIKKKSLSLQELREKKTALLEKSGLRGSPDLIQKRVDSMEEKLETEVMSFDKEKALNKQIRQLKEQLKGNKEVEEVHKKTRPVVNELHDLRKKAKEKHTSVQEEAASSQKQHETMVVSSQEVDKLRKQEEDTYKHFFKYKKVFNELNDILKSLLTVVNADKRKQGVVRKHHEAKKKAQEKKDLKQLEQDVEEKIKKKQKLTTEDLLIFQKD